MSDQENKCLMQTKDLLKCLPHRYPFLLVDKVIEAKFGESIKALKNVTANEPQFTGHFPEDPIMPGVLIIEAMAQAGALIITGDPEFSAEDKLVYFMSIDKAKFRKLVVPGDTLILDVKIIQNRGPVWKLDAKALVDGQIAAEAELKAMIVDKKKEA